MIDLEQIEDKWLWMCGSCDAGLPMDCNCPQEDHRPVILALVNEIRTLRAQVAANQDLADKVAARLSDELLLRDKDLRTSLEQMQRGEGRVLRARPETPAHLSSEESAAERLKVEAVLERWDIDTIREIAWTIRATRDLHPADATCECEAMDALKVILATDAYRCDFDCSICRAGSEDDEEEGMDVVTIHAAEPRFGAQLGLVRLQVHSPKDCVGQHCCVHNPSPHHMVEWPLNWRGDRRLMERICPHGIGHPDPDDIAYKVLTRGAEASRHEGVHGCDGCCVSPDRQQPEEEEVTDA